MTRLDAGRWIRFFAVPGLIAAYGILMSITTVTALKLTWK